MPYSDPAYLIRILKTRPGSRAEIVLVKKQGETRLTFTQGSKSQIFIWVQKRHIELTNLPPDEALPIRYEAPWVKRHRDQPVIDYSEQPEW